MSKKFVVTDGIAIKIANIYSSTNSTFEDIEINHHISKYYIQKAIKKAIVLSLVNLATAKAIKKKAITNTNSKIREIHPNTKGKIVRKFYDSLLKQRENYENLKQENDLLINLLNELEYQRSLIKRNLELALFQENTFNDFVSSEEMDFVPTSSFKLTQELENIETSLNYALKQKLKVVEQINQIEKSVS